MPLWIVYHPPGTFEDAASKRAFSQDATKFYTAIGLPAFYVVVNFIKMPAEDGWVGGELKKDKPFIRVSIDHIAVNMDQDNPDMLKSAATRIEAALKPHVADKGYDWEWHINETDRRLWRVNGMIAPDFQSEQEKVWVRSRLVNSELHRWLSKDKAGRRIQKGDLDMDEFFVGLWKEPELVVKLNTRQMD